MHNFILRNQPNFTSTSELDCWRNMVGGSKGLACEKSTSSGKQNIRKAHCEHILLVRDKSIEKCY